MMTTCIRSFPVLFLLISLTSGIPASQFHEDGMSKEMIPKESEETIPAEESEVISMMPYLESKAELILEENKETIPEESEEIMPEESKEIMPEQSEEIKSKEIILEESEEMTPEESEEMKSNKMILEESKEMMRPEESEEMMPEKSEVMKSKKMIPEENEKIMSKDTIPGKLIEVLIPEQNRGMMSKEIIPSESEDLKSTKMIQKGKGRHNEQGHKKKKAIKETELKEYEAGNTEELSIENDDISKRIMKRDEETEEAMELNEMTTQTQDTCNQKYDKNSIRSKIIYGIDKYFIKKHIERMKGAVNSKKEPMESNVDGVDTEANEIETYLYGNIDFGLGKGHNEKNMSAINKTELNYLIGRIRRKFDRLKMYKKELNETTTQIGGNKKNDDRSRIKHIITWIWSTIYHYLHDKEIMELIEGAVNSKKEPLESNVDGVDTEANEIETHLNCQRDFVKRYGIEINITAINRRELNYIIRRARNFFYGNLMRKEAEEMIPEESEELMMTEENEEMMTEESKEMMPEKSEEMKTIKETELDKGDKKMETAIDEYSDEFLDEYSDKYSDEFSDEYSDKYSKEKDEFYVNHFDDGEESMEDMYSGDISNAIASCITIIVLVAIATVSLI